VFRALVEIAPADAEAFYNLGLALKQQDQFGAAETALGRAAQLDPPLPEAPFTLGVVLWQTGRADEAVQQFLEALARKADYGDAHFMLGTILKQQGALAEAAARFRSAIKYRPTSAEAHRSLGQTLKQQGQEDAALSALAEADRLDRKTADAQASTFAVSVGVEKLSAGDYVGAIERFREALRLAADNPQAHYQLGLALRRTGARDEARSHFAEAHRLSPHLRPPDKP
jgi:Flp pilus assembly protein TadD